MVRFFCTWLGITLFFSGSAQIIYTREFTNKLLAAGAGLNMPKESFYHVIPCEDSKNIFDLCLVSEPDSSELKFVVLDEKAVTKIIFPEIHFMTKVASLATNDDRYWIVLLLHNHCKKRFMQIGLGRWVLSPKVAWRIKNMPKLILSTARTMACSSWFYFTILNILDLTNILDQFIFNQITKPIL